MRKNKAHSAHNKERNKQLTEFSGLREMIIAHKALLRSKPEFIETKEESDQSLSLFFAG